MTRRRPDVTVSFFELGGDQFAVIGVPSPGELPACLTAAEREVVRLVFAGHSNAQIAKARGTSIRTIANQIASAMRKVGATSRADLVARLSNTEPE